MKRVSLAVASMILLFVTAVSAVPVPPAAGPNFQVNQVTADFQYKPDVAQAADGSFAAVWIDLSTVPVPTVKLRLFAASGAPGSNEILVANLPLSASPPRVAMTPTGEIAVAWEDHQTVYLRRFDRLGQPVGSVAVVSHAPYITSHSPDVGLDAAGNAFVVWAVTLAGGDDILLQRFGVDNQVPGAPEILNQPVPFLRDIPRLAVGAAGNLLVSWNDHRLGGGTDVEVWARRYDGASQAWDAEVQISPSGPGVDLQKGSAPILYPQGDGAVVYNNFVTLEILVRRLDAAGAPEGDPIKIGDLGDIDHLFPPDAAASPDGTALVVWEAGGIPLAHAAFFDHSWSPRGETFLLSHPADDSEWLPAVSSGGTGNFVTAWASAGALIGSPIPELPGGARDGHDGDGYGVFAQRFQAPACVPSSEALCLDNRFEVRVSWRDPASGATVAGHVQTLTAFFTGAFWFSDPGNLELMVRVVDARAVNGHFWVEYGSLSNVDFTITVTDVATGAVKAYHNPAGSFASLRDDEAFAEAPPAVQTGVSPGPPPPPQTAAAHCTPSATVLCVLNRFAVQVSFIDPDTGASKSAQAVAVTGSTGVFGFNNVEDSEVMVKVLDARAVNHFFWVFFGALSDLEYTVTVTDNVNHVMRTYHNPAHHLASVADTRAFRARTVPH